jgi:hypothetical protein
MHAHLAASGGRYWLRAKDLLTQKGAIEVDVGVIVDGISPADVSQGMVGDCYFMSALSSMAARPTSIRALLEDNLEYNPGGKYTVKLCIDGVWKRIVVDDWFPCHESVRRSASSQRCRNALACFLIIFNNLKSRHQVQPATFVLFIFDFGD